MTDGWVRLDDSVVEGAVRRVRRPAVLHSQASRSDSNDILAGAGVTVIRLLHPPNDKPLTSACPGGRVLR